MFSKYNIREYILFGKKIYKNKFEMLQINTDILILIVKFTISNNFTISS